MYKHTGEKPHSCLTCGKKFVLKQDLKEHIKTHTERSHFCKICMRGFTTGAYLNRHLKQHKGKGKFQCEECGLAFVTKISLSNHNREYHLQNAQHDKDVSSVVNKLVKNVDKIVRKGNKKGLTEKA
jgi:uncharacterized Zn-finger protein